MQNVDVLVRLGGPTALPIDSVHFDPEVAPGDLLPWQQNVLTALAEMGAPADYAACAFGALGQPIGELPAGTLAIRYTLAGEHLWLTCPTLSYKGGQLGGQTSVLGNYAPPASKESKTPMLGNPLVLGLGKQLAMAVGKSLLKRESPELYEKIFGKELDDISRELTALKDDLKQYLDNMRREMYAQKQHDDFFEVVYWFVQEYKGTMRTHLLGEEVDGDRQHKLLEKKRGDLLVLAGKMQLQLELDQEVDDCTYQARRKVELYRLVGLNYLLLLGEQLYWQRLLAKDEKKYRNNDLIRKYQDFAGLFEGALRKMLARLTDGRHQKLTPVQHIETPAINCYVWRDDFESSASSDPLRSEKKSYLTAYQGNIISFFFPSNLEKMRDEAHGRAVQSHALRQNEIRYSLDVHVASPIGDVFETMEHNIALLQTSPVV